jgi:hypothetical protein
VPTGRGPGAGRLANPHSVYSPNWGLGIYRKAPGSPSSLIPGVPRFPPTLWDVVPRLDRRVWDSVPRKPLTGGRRCGTLSHMAKRVDVRVSEDVFAVWSKEAQDAGVSIGEFVRKTVQGSLKKPSSRPQLSQAAVMDHMIEQIVRETVGQTSERIGDRLEGWLERNLLEDAGVEPLPPVAGELPADVVMKPWGLMRLATAYDPQCENTGTEAHGGGRWCTLCEGNGLPRDEAYEL